MSFTKHFKGGFTAVDNELLNDPTITAKAKGVLCYLLSKPEGWRPVAVDIVNHMIEGDTAIRSGLKELRDAGYMRLVPMQDEQGQLCGSRWEVADFRKWQPDTGETRHWGNPKLGKPPSNNTILQSTLENSKATPKNKGKRLFRNSPLTEDEWKKTFIAEATAGVDIMGYFENIKNWSETSDTMRTTNGWYATARTWMRRDKVKGKLLMVANQEKNLDDMAHYLRMK